ncbi:hypothetical protein HFC70_26090 [Agrobacterium sp. a22-2]|uniref:phosphoribosyltransferase-like protein n=1 Tax=Agrobacterium sp. a22-2 TaxID=2283840 RepID=UPI00144632D6|nr:hypothetical protein [Agrobacterium sp. a22-2]NKN39826.1 hypothetical protein [Agrobacterium sp. a22-2]
MALSFEQLLIIDEVIEAKGWSEKKNRLGGNINDVAFQLFSLTTTEEQFALITHIIKSYFWCTDYYDHCSEIARRITGAFKGEKIAIIPISDSKQKIKSGHSVVYEISCFLDKSDFADLKTLESLSSIKNNVNEYSIIVVDDFVGSGTQFRKFSRRSIANFGIHPADIYLYSIAMMERARIRIDGFCYSASTCFEFRRALSDDTDLNLQMDALDVYAQIESLAVVGKDYVQGYLKSEALVSMKKTPNNTLPIFWCDTSTSGSSWPAMFPRN